MPERSYAIIGSGAVGGLYGARLQRVGLAVHFLCHSDYEHVRRHGLVIESPEGDIRLPQVNAYGRAADMPVCDVVIVALKTTANAILPAALPCVTKPGGTVVILQNGLGAEARVASFVPQCSVVGAMSFLCASKVGPGHVRHLDYGKITLAAYRPDGQPGGITAEMTAIAADLEQSGTSVNLFEDLVQARWQKLVWNVPFNGLSVVLEADTAEMMRNEQTRRLARDLMNEVVAGAAVCGRHIPPEFVEQMVVDTERMTPHKTSMVLDYENRRPMEVESIYGEPLRVAEGRGACLPLTRMLYAQLKFLDERNTRVCAPDHIQRKHSV